MDSLLLVYMKGILQLWWEVVFIVLGFMSGKISGDSFTYISLTGTLLAILQILLVVAILMLGIAMLTPAIIIDLLLLLFSNLYFPLVGNTWHVVWNQVTVGWFWTETSGSSLLFSSIILAVISFFAIRKKR
jgi:hypothetical protein